MWVVVLVDGVCRGVRMGRRCSHCGNNGHNSRTCSSPSCVLGGGGGGGGLRLFGVQLHIASPPMRKSFSMDCLSSSPYVASPSPSPSSSASSSSLVSIDEIGEKISSGSLSDGLIGGTPERKKGVPWTENEHRFFLAGLEEHGRGDWRGISRNFVATRTPTQVASHAQKYFLRQNSLNKKKRRSSLFDAVGSCGRTAHFTGYSKSSIDLNSSEQESHLPPCLHLMPESTPSIHALQSSPTLIDRPHADRLQQLDLELSISSSKS